MFISNQPIINHPTQLQTITSTTIKTLTKDRNFPLLYRPKQQANCSFLTIQYRSTKKKKEIKQKYIKKIRNRRTWSPSVSAGTAIDAATEAPADRTVLATEPAFDETVFRHDEMILSELGSRPPPPPPPPPFPFPLLIPP